VGSHLLGMLVSEQSIFFFAGVGAPLVNKTNGYMAGAGFQSRITFTLRRIFLATNSPVGPIPADPPLLVLFRCRWRRTELRTVQPGVAQRHVHRHARFPFCRPEDQKREGRAGTY